MRPVRKNTMTPTQNGEVVASKPLKPQKSVFDLNTMEEVTLYKEVPFTPVKNTQEALAILGGDATRLIEVINRGLRSEVTAQAMDNPEIPFFVVPEEDKEDTKEVFTGTVADKKMVNTLILTFAKTIFGYSKESKRDEKRAAKESAIEMIKNTPAIREGLKKSAATQSAVAEEVAGE